MIERRNGTIRDRRLSKDLLDSNFQIDSQSSWELIGYIASYLEKLNYYNLNNKIEGNWKELVENDPVIFMSLIITKSTEDIDKLIEGFNSEMLKDDITQTLFKWYEIVNGWQANLRELGEDNLAEKIKNSLVNTLTFNREYLVPYYEEYRKKMMSEQKMISSIPSAMFKYEDYDEVRQKKELSKIQLDGILHDLRKAIAHTKEMTIRHLEKNFLGRNDHSPNNALYIAFTSLYTIVQKKLNSFSEKHLDFYYKDVLQQKQQKGKPTRTIVNFDLLPTVSSTRIPKGTQISAGKTGGAKKDVIFETNKPLRAQLAEIVNIQTLIFNRNPYIDIGTNNPIISSASINKLMRYSQELVPREDWFVFGANKQTLQDTKIHSGNTANIGFILGSPVLLMKEGQRTITITMKMDETTAAEALWRLIAEIESNHCVSRETAFAYVFRDSFKIYCSTKKGWEAAKSYITTYSKPDNTIIIRLELDNSYPSVQTSPEIPEDLEWPSVKVELNEYAPVYAYSFLKEVQLETITIDVSVKNIKDVSLYNNVGKMPLGKPFEIFGPQPAIDSFLMIGYSELFKKRIDTLNVELEWDGLPGDYGGFETYYEDYNVPITNDAFKVRFSALSNHFWLPFDKNESPAQNLFGTQACITPEGYNSVVLDKTSSLSFQKINELDIAVDQSIKDPLLYQVNSPTGFFRISLTSPEYGFADTLYQQEFTDVANYNAKHKRQLPYPNKPFIPKLKGVTLAYSSKDILYLKDRISGSDDPVVGKGEFQHINPNFTEKVIENGIARRNTLLPEFKDSGYLILGIKGVESRSSLAIYFHFLRSSSANNIDENALKWEYLSIPDWHQFNDDDIVLDNTNGFIKSGIVELLLPNVEGAERGYHEDILWIRVSVKEGVHNYPKIKGIYLNAVEATCVSDEETIIGKNLPAGSVKKVMGDLPDIKSVNQAASSFGGKKPEEKKHMYTRVSEQLRHKGRAVSVWDYERIILENFNDVRIVKCTNFNDSFEPVPGQVKVVVLSTRWTKDERYYFNKGSLERMKDFLNRISSSFIDIEVINPDVEYLLVNCRIKFRPEDTGGYYRNQLNEDISEYLSPISNMDRNTGGIGGTVIPNKLASYVENLPYILKLEELTIEHIIRDGINQFSMGVHEVKDEIKAVSPWSILVPMKEHRILTKEDKTKIPDLSKIGIGAMIVGTDLILGEEFHPESESETENKRSVPQEDEPMDFFLEFKNKA